MLHMRFSDLTQTKIIDYIIFAAFVLHMIEKISLKNNYSYVQ